MEVRPIESAADYNAALVEIEKLWGSDQNSAKDDSCFDTNRLDVLLTLVDAYEKVNHAINAPDVVEAIKFRMKQLVGP